MKLFKSAFREIKGSLGRYLAIFSIVIIGVGFFSGLSICKDAMIETADRYLGANNLYDYRILSTLGFTAEDVEEFKSSGITSEGAYFTDVLVANPGESEHVFRVHSITDDINKIDLKYGRMPNAPNECIADSQVFGERAIGNSITISPGNSESTLDLLEYDEYVIVGVGSLPYYMSIELGASDIGSGYVGSYFCIPPEGFSSEYYHEVYAAVNSGERAYSSEYAELIDEHKGAATAIAEERAELRYDGIMEDIMAAAALYPNPQAALENFPMPEPPSVFVLTRNANVSYVSYENDSGIVGGIAQVFPVFFFLVAALVCITTMSRMVEEQRTQIGVLKSLGYGNVSIISKYFIYSGSAGVLGCLLGYFIGTYLFPATIWKAFTMLYPFTDSMAYVFDGWLLAASLAVTCLCTIGVTLLSCAAALRSSAANLIRPKAPKSGKRTPLELITPLWNRLTFLQKVSLRNLFRYKRRFFMMIIGIGGCTALLVGGFGIRDSINHVVSSQYEEITLYDAEISFSSVPDSEDDFLAQHSGFIKSLIYISASSADMSIDDRMKNIYVIAPHSDTLDGFMELRSGGEEIALPKQGEVILNSGLASDMEIVIGDELSFTSKGLKTIELTVSGIFDNYISNFAYVSIDTAEKLFDNSGITGAYLLLEANTDSDAAATALLTDKTVGNVSLTESTRRSITNSMQSMNYIVIVVILCAGALAFVVLYNLTNINITERLREIATVKVLGFYDSETSTYVFRENNILTFFGAAVGLLLGKFLHTYVMMQVNIEFIKFSTYVDWKSYIYSAALTLAFSFIMQIIMNRKLTRINMAESLKTVE